MLKPVIFLGMIERGKLSGDGINPVGVVVFEVVAALARNGEVDEIVGAAFGTGNGVLNRQRVGRVAGLTDTVLATTPITLLDKLPLLGGETGYRHIRLDVFHNFRIRVDTEACHQIRKGLIAACGKLDECLNPLDVEGFDLGADVDELAVFFGGEGFGLTFGDEVVVMFPSFRREANVDGLQQRGFVIVRCGLESFLEGVEDEAIGFHALLGRFGLKSLGEFWGEIQGESGHSDCAQ
jgi:hypothetical protein